MANKNKKCDHIIAFHIGHEEIRLSEARKSKGLQEDGCCGGIMELNFCPDCAIRVVEIIKRLNK